MKKKLSLALITLLAVTSLFAFTGCSSKDEDVSDGEAKKIKIGIVQFMEHPSLDTIKESTITELANNGFIHGQNITIDEQNAQGDPSNLKTICQKFVSSKYDLIIAIATPAAQSAVSETKDIPIIFSACTDPISAGLVKSIENPGGNVTGTSDAVSASKIIELAEQITPNIQTIGALYDGGEANSLSVIQDLKAYAKEKNIKVIDATVTNISEAQQASASLVGKVDIIFSPIDNKIASAMPIVAQITKDAKIPMYVSADSMVKDGGLATYGINYESLGKETASMIIEVINGKKPADLPVRTIDDMKVYVNAKTAKAIGVTIDDSILSEATVFN